MRAWHSFLLRATVGLSVGVPAAVHSQGPQQPVQVEGRVDAIVARTTGV